MNYTVLMLGVPSIIRSIFNAVFIIMFGLQYSIDELSRITVSIIAFQPIQIIALGIMISEIFVCLRLFDIVRQRIYPVHQMEKVSE